MKKNIIIVGLILFTFLFSFWFFYLRNAKENGLIKEGNIIVQKVEAFNKQHQRLPNSLEEIGIAIKSETDPPLYYQKRDSLNYILWFGTSLGESKIYYSDSKKWEDYQR